MCGIMNTYTVVLIRQPEGIVSAGYLSLYSTYLQNPNSVVFVNDGTKLMFNVVGVNKKKKKF